MLIRRPWVLASSTAAPIALIGAWLLAESRQPSGYDPVHDTISALAAHGATDRWIMTSGLAVLGLCHIVTAAGLREAGIGARALLALGGLATVAVAALAQPNPGHVPAATLGFLALAVWPVVMTTSDRRLGVAMTTVLVILLIWLGVELHSGAELGLSERVLAGAESLAPMAIVYRFARRRTARAAA